MSLLLDRDFMEHFELSKLEAKQQLNSAVDSMYDKMMDELKQWISDRADQQNQNFETHKSQIPIKMESIVIKHEVCDCVECMNECRIVKRMTKSNKEETKMSTFCVTQESGNEPKGRDVDQMDAQSKKNDPIGTQMNNTQMGLFHNITQPVNCQSIPLTQSQNKQILEQKRNNNFDDEEEYDQELLDEVKREIEEENALAALNKHRNEDESVSNDNHEQRNNKISPIGTQIQNSQLNLPHDTQSYTRQPPTPPSEPFINHQPQEQILEQIWNNDEFDDIYENDPETLDQTELGENQIFQGKKQTVPKPRPGEDSEPQMDHHTIGIEPIGTLVVSSQLDSFVMHTGEYQSDQISDQRNETDPIGTLQANTSNRRYQCDQCSKCFNRSHTLRTHKLIHQNVKPFQCDQCSKCFNIKSNLQAHKLLHQNVKPYQCDQCCKSFAQNGNLQVHKLIHQNVKPFQCDQCSKCFNQKRNLKAHKLTHQNGQAFQCDQCSKRFAQKAYLTAHQLIHSDKRRYQCDQCPKGYTRKVDMQKHKLTHEDHPNNQQPVN